MRSGFLRAGKVASGLWGVLASILFIMLFQNCGRSFSVSESSHVINSIDDSLMLQGRSALAASASTKSVGPIQLGQCKTKSGLICAVWTETNSNSASTEESEAELSLSSSNTLIESGLLGEHTLEGKVQRLAYLYYMISANETQVSILNLDSKRIIAATRANAGAPIFGTNLGMIRGPQDLKYPFLSPGYVPQITSSSWMWFCRFDPALVNLSTTPQAPASDCGTGFRRFTIDFLTPQALPAYQVAASKHSGFMIMDVDRDGWEDVTFPYFQGHLVTFSGKTGAQIGFANFDVAAAEGDYLPYYKANRGPLFHGGRLYGGFFEVKASAAPMQVVVAGDVVGRFKEGGEWCNVSRYIAGFRWSGGFQLAWTHYVGWGRTLFNDDGSAVRQGDEVGRCIHRIADSVLDQDAKSYVIYNQFDVLDRSTQCNRLALQYQGNISSAEAAQRYTDCLGTIAAVKPGYWNLNILDAPSGQKLSTLSNHYVWGRVDGVWPQTSKALFLLHQNQNEGNFSQTAENLKAYTLAYVDKGQMAPLSSLQCPSAVPVLREGTVGGNVYGTYASGKNTSTDNVGLRQVTVQDIDGDGLNDILLADGRWIGYVNGRLDYKGGARPSCVRRAQIKWTSDGLYACRVDNGAAVVSSNSNADRSGAWPTASMFAGYVTADLSQAPLVSFNCTSPSGAAQGVDDLKLTFRLQSQGTDGYWAAHSAVACGVTSDAGVVGGGQSDGREMSGFFNTSASTQGLNLKMECASSWGWTNGVNDRVLKIQVIPQ